MILSTKGRYAVMAMVELAGANNEKPTSLAAIAEAQDIPLNYLEQIFASLRKQALVHAVRGPGGGYLLAKLPDDISIGEVMQASEERMEMTRCAPKDGGCRPGKLRCATHDLWEGLTDHIQSYLSAISLRDVIEGKPLPQPCELAVQNLYQIREPAV